MPWEGMNSLSSTLSKLEILSYIVCGFGRVGVVRGNFLFCFYFVFIFLFCFEIFNFGEKHIT